MNKQNNIDFTKTYSEDEKGFVYGVNSILAYDSV